MMNKNLAGCGLGIMLAVFPMTGDAWATSGVIPEITIPAGDKLPVIDGNLGDAVWRQAAVITNFDFIMRGRDEDRVAGHKALVMHDDAWLYVGFDVKHPRPEFIQPKYLKRDERVQAEDCVKVTFDPGTDGKHWYHFRLSSANIQSDQESTPRGIDKGNWNFLWPSVTRKTATGWQAELAIPLAPLIKDADLSKARLNLMINSMIPVVDKQ